MRRCYCVTAGTGGGARPTKRTANPTRVYREDDHAAWAANAASEEHSERFGVAALDDIPDWATEVETANREIVDPKTLAEDPVYAMRYRPATQFGTLPPGVEIAHWARVPEDLHRAFPNRPISKRRFGGFIANRALTADELDRFQIDVID